MAVADVMKMIKDNEVRFVDLRFTDTRGKEQHVTVPAHQFEADKFEHGHAIRQFGQRDRRLIFDVNDSTVPTPGGMGA